jgi:Uma2 family endonuclease
MTETEFPDCEAEQADRHEFINGEVFAMAGAEDRHVTVSGNAYMTLRQHLAGSLCRTYMADMRLWVAASKSYFYPDVLVTCSERDVDCLMMKFEPKLIIDVLSKSTAAFDRGGKFSHYRLLSSLEEYMLIDLDARNADVCRKGVDGLWVLHPFAKGEVVALASVDLTLAPEQLFAEVPDESLTFL